MVPQSSRYEGDFRTSLLGKDWRKYNTTEVHNGGNTGVVQLETEVPV